MFDLRYLVVYALLVACSPAAVTPEPAAAAPPQPATLPSQPATPAATQNNPTNPPAASDPIRAAVEASDRTPEDAALDAGRKPAELLAFMDVRPGQRVLELAAGGGYTAELLARVVGSAGKVYGQNSKFILDRFAEQPWSDRLTKPVMSNVVRLDREFDDPIPSDLTNLDLVTCILFYHDTVWLKVDRAAMNRAIFRALKPGGSYVIVDHRAAAGAGTKDVETLHRIEQTVVQREVEAAGFRLSATADFLANPADTRDWNASPRSAGERRGQSDRFVLKFTKPGAP